MNGRDMNLRHLRAFVEVCRHQNISAAASAVHLSQPAITQAIAKLEHDLSVGLFTRSSKGMFPTEAARILLRRTEQALAKLRAGARKVRRGGGSSRQTALFDVMTSTQLKALIAVAAHGNYSVAARAIGMSQPSLYRTARDLEALAGQALYLKSARGIDLTSEAKALARAARLAFAELDHAIEDLAEISGKATGTLRIGALPLARGTILPRALNDLAERHPGLNVQVIDSPFDDMLHALRHGEIDLMLGALRRPPPAPDIQQEPLFEDRLGVFCRPAHPLLTGKVPSRTALAAYPWIVARPGAPTRDHFDQFFADIPAGMRGPILESNALMLVRGLLRGSDRLTMISDAQMAEEVQAGTLCRVPVDLHDTPRPIGVTYRADWHPTSAQSEFLSILRTCAQDIRQ